MDLEYELRTEENNVEIEEDNLDISAIEDVGGLQEIDKLEAVGINVGDIKKLKAAGMYTMASIMMATSTQLTNIKGLSEAKVQKIIECVKKVRLKQIYYSFIFEYCKILFLFVKKNSKLHFLSFFSLSKTCALR